VREPKRRDTGDESSECERLKRALALHAAHQDEVKPDGAGVVRFDGESDRQTDDGERDEAILKETENSDDGETDHEPSRVPGHEQHTAVDEDEKDERPNHARSGVG